MTDSPARTPLHDRHVRAGARLVPFAGYEMPIQYGSILAEHRAVRSSAGLFDVSHMGEFRVRGPDAVAFSQRLFTNDLTGTRIGRARYGLLCDENGGIIDDVTAYMIAADEVLFCVNAANVAGDWAWFGDLHARHGPDCALIDESSETALLALQGPRAPSLVAGLLPPGTEPPRPWRFARVQVAGVPSLLAATGYTGERGFEVYAPAERAGSLWDAIVDAGGDDLTLAGLGARDTLRTEMAYPLYGHELTRQTNPIEAGLERFCAFGRNFLGEPAVEAERTRGPARKLVGLVLDGRQVARPGFAIRRVAGGSPEPAGVVTSGTYGPTVERSIAIGYVPADWAATGTRLHIEVRGRPVPCAVTETPFLKRPT